jgi:hypothetical protein
MGNQNEQIRNVLLPEPEDPQSPQTMLPSHLVRRELVISSTLEMESTFSFSPKSGTLEGWGQVALPD